MLGRNTRIDTRRNDQTHERNVGECFHVFHDATRSCIFYAAVQLNANREYSHILGCPMPAGSNRVLGHNSLVQMDKLASAACPLQLVEIHHSVVVLHTLAVPNPGRPSTDFPVVAHRASAVAAACPVAGVVRIPGGAPATVAPSVDHSDSPEGPIVAAQSHQGLAFVHHTSVVGVASFADAVVAWPPGPAVVVLQRLCAVLPFVAVPSVDHSDNPAGPIGIAQFRLLLVLVRLASVAGVIIS